MCVSEMWWLGVRNTVDGFGQIFRLAHLPFALYHFLLGPLFGLQTLVILGKDGCDVNFYFNP